MLIGLNSFLVWWQRVRCLAGVFGKALFCERSSAVVLRLGTGPLGSVRGVEPSLLSELFDCQVGSEVLLCLMQRDLF